MNPTSLARALIVVLTVLLLVGSCIWYLAFYDQPYLPPGY